MKFGWYNRTNFNVADYQLYEKIENGDFNWIIPGKFLAFTSPVDKKGYFSDFGLGPDYYAPLFNKIGVKMVIRLNNPEYDREVTCLIYLHRNSLTKE